MARRSGPPSDRGLRRFDLRVELVDLRDQRIDAVERILPPLLELAELRVALGEARAQQLVLGAQRAVARDQLEDRLLQSFELGPFRPVGDRVRDPLGDGAGRLMRELGNVPAPPIRKRGYPAASKPVKREKLAGADF
jgi:hypothetical protein